ncbi:hypothetical protein B0H15DRAFT_918090 [Mycena belliarum]|uniref:CxC2-like cysteine cluster KDZ transposase-associated domain-containing protein n=1 Tax=Mycena belliarum TaxID=1033014 RepID=A0AAD6TNL7_9AGAR|nr:hypothetical protein B0H15DRAFT_918090 [Mycena belliae]
MGREWRHLRMLKRAGRGHAKGGVDGTKAGECALLCPACPQPGMNLPPNWKEAPKEKNLLTVADRFLYALFLAIDANFRMRRKKVSSEEKDPSLGDGWSFYGAIAPYYDYLAKHWHQKQPRSTCVAHDAVDKPDRESRGTASSGIATVDCARHNMKRPNAVGDLQLGERYINMDYIFFMGLAGSELSELYVSYDIACQWHKNIWERMRTFDKGVRFRQGQKYCVFLIPKFHLPAHIEACNILFSFHLTRYVGMTDGEAPERGWAHLGPLAASTAEMGPGSRRDAINDFFNDWNHKKIIGFGVWAMRKIQECVPEMITTSMELEELETSLRNLGAGDALDEWRVEVEAWEEDASNPNPFESRVKQKTVVGVRLEMAEEAKDEMDEEELGGMAVSDEMHPTEMIGMGIQLEELQRALAFDISGVGSHPSPEQQTNMTERTNKLRRKLLTWMDTQATFIPHVSLLRAEEDRARLRISVTQAQPGVKVQHLALWLPSDIKGRVDCDIELYQYEFRLREAQAHEALDDLRHQLLLRTHLYKHKDMYVRGVKANTRCLTKIKTLEERIRRTSDRYRAARRALVGLGRELNETGWQAALQPLLVEDVRGMPRALDAKEMGMRAKQKMSWIWRSPGVDEGEAGATGMNEALRIEWAKTRARAMRQQEQVDLLEEEMRRVLVFLRWRADWWEGMAGERLSAREESEGIAFADKDCAYSEGNVAYAKRQAGRLRKLAGLFEEKWGDVPDFISMGRMALGVLPEEEEMLGEPDAGAADEEPVPLRQLPPVLATRAAAVAIPLTFSGNDADVPGFTQSARTM